MRSTSLWAVASLLATTALASVDPIVIKGSKFFYKTNGTQFFIKGVAYQQDYTGGGAGGSGISSNGSDTATNYVDPLADSSSCMRDIPYLQQLSTNTIRVYALDPTQNHDTCMNALANAGIYVIADLSAPGLSIDRNDPQWTDDLYNRYTAVIDNMQKYTNTLGFFAGNEVSNSINTTEASAFVKAAVRDMKAYISSQNYRAIGVGYATSDDQYIRQDVGQYFDCGSSSSAIDFLGYNIYSWCGDSSYQQSGYADRTQQFSTYNVPVFFAEYGCNQVEPRTFTDVATLYGSEMTPVWSGGIVYMYFQEANDYGLVTVSGNSVSTLVDFGYYSSAIAAVSPSGINSASYTPTNTAAQSCPTVGSNWAATTVLPPTPNEQLCECMYNALNCIPNTSVLQQTGYGAIFGYICGVNPSACAGIQANGTTGTYGSYEMCNPEQQLGWVMNAYYLAQPSSQRASACSFSGSATLRSVSAPTGTCASLISQAGAQGTGSVTSKPSGTAKGSGGSSGSGNAAPRIASTPSYVSTLTVVSLVCAAFVSGMGMILL